MDDVVVSLEPTLPLSLGEELEEPARQYANMPFLTSEADQWLCVSFSMLSLTICFILSLSDVATGGFRWKEFFHLGVQGSLF